MNAAAFCLAYAGFSALSLGMDRHYEAVFARALSPRHRWWLRAAGWAVLLMSLLACAAAWGWSYGAVEWLGILSLAGLALIWWLAYWPRAALAAGGACAVAAPLLAWM